MELGAYIAVISYCGLLVIAAISDIITYRIPNIIVLALLLIFPIATIAVPLQPVVWFWHGFGMLISLLVGLIAWRIELMGGGDVKLIAVLGFWTGVFGLPKLFLTIALIGGCFTILLIVMRFFTQKFAVRPKHLPAIVRRGEPVPYGVAIASGGLLSLPDLPMF